MAVTGYSVFYDYGPNYLRNVAIMNIPLTQTSQEAEHWQALEMHNLLLIRKHLVHKREFYYQAKQTNQSSRTTFELLPIKL
jgi:hypothetical protein